MRWWRKYGRYAQPFETTCAPTNELSLDPHQSLKKRVVRLVCHPKRRGCYERKIWSTNTPIVSAHRPFAQRRVRGGSRRFAVASQAGRCENEAGIGGVPGFAKGRSRMQQLLTVPRAECLHAGRRRDKPEGLVQILGQKGRLTPIQWSSF